MVEVDVYQQQYQMKSDDYQTPRGVVIPLESPNLTNNEAQAQQRPHPHIPTRRASKLVFESQTANSQPRRNISAPMNDDEQHIRNLKQQKSHVDSTSEIIIDLYRNQDLIKHSHAGSDINTSKNKILDHDDHHHEFMEFKPPRPSGIGKTYFPSHLPSVHTEPEHKVKEKLELLNEWIVIAKNYCWLHSTSCKLFQGLNFSILIPIITVSTIAGALNLTQFTCSSSYISYILGFMSLGSAALSTIHNTLKFGERAELHKATADEFDKLTREISVETLLTDTEAKTYANLAEFIKECNDRFNRLIEKSPSIPERVMIRFEKIKQQQHNSGQKNDSKCSDRTSDNRGRFFDFYTSRNPVSSDTVNFNLDIFNKMQELERKKRIPCL